MDTTEVYVKMCEKAEEIQRSWNHTGGDVFFIKEGEFIFGEPAEGGWVANEGDVVYSSSYEFPENGESTNKYYHDLYIWLPRQDQLQEMCWTLTDTKWTPFFALTVARDFANEHPFQTMEQLWLAFVMKEKYGKVWSGEEWICQ